MGWQTGLKLSITGKFFGTKKPKVYLEYTDKNGQTKKKNCKVTSWSMNRTTGESELKFFVPKLPNSFPARTYHSRWYNKIGIATAIHFTC